MGRSVIDENGKVMVKTSNLRGHPIVFVNGEWLYEDNYQSTMTSQDRPCGHCGRKETVEGHDGCLGTLPGVLNACCGHGTPKEAYVQFENGKIIRGFNVT